MREPHLPTPPAVDDTPTPAEPAPESAGSLDPTYPAAAEFLPRGVLAEGRYEVSFARTEQELDELLRLRFEVFNVELEEGLETSWDTGRDEDEFDPVCHHLIVRHVPTDAIVGTYRMQTTSMARRFRGLYSATEYDLSALPELVMDSAVEVGRACVAPEHRNTHVLFLLWKGLAMYMTGNHLRFLFGCCSLTSQNPVEGWAVWNQLEARDQLHADVRVAPLADFACDAADPEAVERFQVKIPKLFRTYLRHGAKVCSPPAIDRRFKTIDFLVLFDVAAMDEKRVRTFFG